MKNRIVNGIGPRTSPIVFIGEAPGEQEENLGIPFIGRSGQLLRRVMKEVGFDDNEVYITNLVKFRPPNNRAPTPEEIEIWGPKLFDELTGMYPTLVVTVGRHSSQYLLNTKESISNIRGKIHLGKRFNILPTFHPSYILRDNSKEQYLKADLLLAYNEVKNELR